MQNVKIQSDVIAEVAYPPPPWHLSGQSWLGFFRADVAPALPDGLKHLPPSRWLAVALIRYLSGTLVYDELIIGSLARGRGRVGLFVHHIWVNDVQSLWGGRKIWGLQKELAQFTWQDDSVRISDDNGLIATIRVNKTAAWLPPLPLLMPSYGQRNEEWLFTTARLNARLGRAGMTMEAWSDRFPWRIESAPRFAVAGKPFAMTFVPPVTPRQ